MKPNRSHLGLGELQFSGELCPLRDGEILLLPVLLLQGVQLGGGEGGPGLPVGFVFPQQTSHRAERDSQPQVCCNTRFAL